MILTLIQFSQGKHESGRCLRVQVQVCSQTFLGNSDCMKTIVFSLTGNFRLHENECVQPYREFQTA